VVDGANTTLLGAKTPKNFCYGRSSLLFAIAFVMIIAKFLVSACHGTLVHRSISSFSERCPDA